MEIEHILPVKFRKHFIHQKIDMDRLREIRFRIGQPVELFDGQYQLLCEEKVDRLCSMLCSSPISAKTSSKMESSERSSAGI